MLLRAIHIDCSSGISGRGLLGAMTGLGMKPEVLAAEIKNVLSFPFSLNIRPIVFKGVMLRRAEVFVEAGAEYVQADSFIKHFISSEKTPLNIALQNFLTGLLKARAKVSGLPRRQVLLPRSALAKIMVIAAGFLAAKLQLGVSHISATPIPLGLDRQGGQTETDLLILELAKGAAVKQNSRQHPVITPLGVALLTDQVDAYGTLPEMTLAETAFGVAGCSKKGINRIQVFYGAIPAHKTHESCEKSIMVLETAIDDMNPEYFPFLIERLLKAGAADCFLTPIYMKKGRPAHLLTVLCPGPVLDTALNLIFTETTTLGVRFREENRRILPRYIIEVPTGFGPVKVKVSYLTAGGRPVNIAPEFEDCKRLALKHNIPIHEIYDTARQAAITRLSRETK